MRITREMVSEAEKLGACQNGIQWAKNHIGMEITQIDISNKRKRWYIAWVIQHLPSIDLINILTDSQIWELCQREPWTGLKYTQKRLTDSQIWELCQREPWAGLKYTQKRLTDEQIRELKAL